MKEYIDFNTQKRTQAKNTFEKRLLQTDKQFSFWLKLGDFNIHMDLPDDTDCRNMSDLLVSMGLKQHVLQPTHELGHTLDLIITLISDIIIAGRPYTGELFSDHFPVFCQLKPERPLVAVKHLQFRKN